MQHAISEIASKAKTAPRSVANVISMQDVVIMQPDTTIIARITSTIISHIMIMDLGKTSETIILTSVIFIVLFTEKKPIKSNATYCRSLAPRKTRIVPASKISGWLFWWLLHEKCWSLLQRRWVLGAKIQTFQIIKN